jgi:RecA-family ATPase
VADAKAVPSFALVGMDEIEAEEIDFMWDQWISRGGLALITGLPGLGKSQVVIWIVACATTGRPWPDGAPGCKPITAFIGSGRGFDSHRASDVRAHLGPLKDLAEKHRVAVVCITHPPKAGGPNAQDQVIGTQAFTAAAHRAVRRRDAGRRRRAATADRT